jgi:integrase
VTVETNTLIGLTLREAGQLWLRRAERDQLEPSTIRQYCQHLRLHIEPLMGDCLVSTLSPPALESFKDQMLQTRSRMMAKKVLTSLKGVLEEAVRLGYADRNPAAGVRIRHATRGESSDSCTPGSGARVPSKVEIRSLLQHSGQLFPLLKAGGAGSRASAGTWWHAFFVCAVFTGMRASELRGLSWDRVDLGRRLICVRQRADFRGKIGRPKTAAGNRDIPMSPMVAGTLTEWQPKCPPTDFRLVFPSRNGRVQMTSNIHKMCWVPLQLAAGMTALRRQSDGAMALRPRFTFHALRHAAASLFIEQGWQPKKVQTVLGHSSIQMTFDIYGKLWSDLDTDLLAMAKLEHQLLSVANISSI